MSSDSAADRAAVWRKIGSRHAGCIHRDAGEIRLITLSAITGQPNTQAPISIPGGSSSVHDGFIKNSALARRMHGEAGRSPLAPAPAGGSAERPRNLIPSRSLHPRWPLREQHMAAGTAPSDHAATWDNAVIVSEKTAKDLKSPMKIASKSRSTGTASGAQSGGCRVSPMVHLVDVLAMDVAPFGPSRQWRGIRRLLLAFRLESVLCAGAKVRKLGETFPAGRRAASLHNGRPRAGQVATSLEKYKQDPQFAQKESETAPKGLTIFPQDVGIPRLCMGHGHRPDVLRRLQRLRGGLPGGKQHRGGRQGAGAQYARDALDSHRPLLQRQSPTNPKLISSPWPACSARTRPARWFVPVAATEHDQEGLNNMVYNRCVGTRYCSNNCPYKVRRFNFLLFTDWETESVKLQRNPDVTVRSRGVMEKCTYCIQRINYAKITAEKAGSQSAGRRNCTGVCRRPARRRPSCSGISTTPRAVSRNGSAKTLNYGLAGRVEHPSAHHLSGGVRNPNPAMLCQSERSRKAELCTTGRTTR